MILALIAIGIGIFLVGIRVGIDYADYKWLQLGKELNNNEWAEVFKNLRK